MHDLPSQTLLQQSNARPKSGEELEVLGKTASALYLRGGLTLNDAVVETVKKAGLSPEQVKRVIEFANTDAYLKEFEKKSSTEKYIAFEGGPANPAEVLKDLNDGGGGTVFDRGDGDYSSPPTSTAKMAAALLDRNRAAVGLEKTATAYRPSEFNPAETAFEQMWAVEDKPLPYANPLEDSLEMKDKLAAVDDELRYEIDSTERLYADTLTDLYAEVKEAAAAGMPLGDILYAWQQVVPGSGFVKAAFTFIGPKLVKDGVFSSLDELGGSMAKVASQKLMVNTQHPLVTTFAAHCTALEKLAHLREARREVTRGLHEITEFLKVAGRIEELAAAGGAIPKALKSAWGKAGVLGQKLEPYGQALGGGTVGKVIKYAPQTALAAGGALVGEEAYQRAVKHGPGGRVVDLAKARTPGTQEYYMRQMELAQNPGLL